ncbi:MAG: cysteine hydrolase family protein [Caldimonas sp.]
MPTDPERTPVEPGSMRSRAALLVIDLFSTWDFPDAPAVGAEVLKIVPGLARFAARCRSAGMPVVFVNDNQGRWQSDSRTLIERCAAASPTGSAIAAHLHPYAEDYFVFKPKHSAFFATPLDLLLRNLGVLRLLLAGATADQCIATTAVEARVHDYEVTVLSDGVASKSASRRTKALEHLRTTHGISHRPCAGLRLDRLRR